MIRSVAVIGVGAMGHPIAQRIKKAGFELTVFDQNQDALAPFAATGARIAICPADCALSHLVIILVATADQVRETVLGTRGLVSGLGGGRPPILAIMSTVSIGIIKELREKLNPSDVRLVDAPVSGGAIGAEEGTLTVMMGGDGADIDVVKPVFESFATNLFNCGGLGSAQIMKIVNNVISIANTVIGAEAYRLALEHGLSVAETARVLEVSTGRNFLSTDKAAASSLYAAIAPDRGRFDSIMKILRKDISLAIALTSNTEGNYPAILALMSTLTNLGGETFDNWKRVADASLDAR